MTEYQDINLLFCNKNKLNVERNQYKRYSDKQLDFYKKRIFQIQNLLHRLFLLKSMDEQDKLENTDNEIEELEYMLPDNIQVIYDSFLVETIDYFSFQDQSDELQEEIKCQIQKNKMNKLREKLNTVDVDLDGSSDEFSEEYLHSTNEVTNNSLEGDIDNDDDNDEDDDNEDDDEDDDNDDNDEDDEDDDNDDNENKNEKGSNNLSLNPLTNTLIVKKKSINNKAFVKKPVLHKKHTFNPYSSKQKKKVVYGKKYK
jgi:TATA-binding protein-associated factor Taf7